MGSRSICDADSGGGIVERVVPQDIIHQVPSPAGEGHLQRPLLLDVATTVQ